MAYAAQAKIIKRPGQKVDEIESQVSQVSLNIFNGCDWVILTYEFPFEWQAILELEVNSELKPLLRELHIVGARELDASANKKAIIVYVPPPQLKAWQKVQSRVVRELEKKFSGRHVVFIAKRTMLRKPGRKSRVGQKRPRSRTLTSVHEATLADIVYPAEVVGKRTRIRLDGKRVYKIHLDKTSQTQVDHKTDTFASVYKRLTGKTVSFEFPEPLF